MPRKSKWWGRGPADASDMDDEDEPLSDEQERPSDAAAEIHEIAAATLYEDVGDEERTALERADELETEAEEARQARTRAAEQVAALRKAERESMERAMREEVEAERAAQERAASERTAAELAEAEAAATERAAEERAAAEAAARRRSEAERLAQQHAEAERQALEHAAEELAAAERAAQQRQEAETKATETGRLEREISERAVSLRERAEEAIDRRRAAEKGVEELLAKERAARARLAAERAAAARAAAERSLAAQIALEKAQAELAAAERQAAERAQAAKSIAERVAKAQAQAERAQSALGNAEDTLAALEEETELDDDPDPAGGDSSQLDLPFVHADGERRAADDRRYEDGTSERGDPAQAPAASPPEDRVAEPATALAADPAAAVAVEPVEAESGDHDWEDDERWEETDREDWDDETEAEAERPRRFALLRRIVAPVALLALLGAGSLASIQFSDPHEGSSSTFTEADAPLDPWSGGASPVSGDLEPDPDSAQGTRTELAALTGVLAGAPAPTALLGAGMDTPADRELTPPWVRNAVPAESFDGRPMIAVVIDDMGVDRDLSDRTVSMPAPLTLAFLPYADEVAGQAERARSAGHELLIHMPMEPNSERENPGPNSLAVELADAEIEQRLRWSFSRVPGVVGINNHMGSRFTRDPHRMQLVVRELARNGYLFLDSMTSQQSVAWRIAADATLPYTARDVFLDHESSPAHIWGQIALLERRARRQGTAVGIGHPRPSTLEALAKWLPDARSRGLHFVPVTAVVRKQRGI